MVLTRTMRVENNILIGINIASEFIKFKEASLEKEAITITLYSLMQAY